MIQTKRQYDHIVGALNAQNVERKVPTEPNGPVVEAFVSGSQLFVASHDAAGKRWTPVLRETLADGLRMPHTAQDQAARGAQHDATKHAEPPAMPTTIAPSQMHLEPITHAPLIFHMPRLWDVNYTDFLVDEAHHYYAPAPAEPYALAQDPADYPPLAFWPIAPAQKEDAAPKPARNQPPTLSSGQGVFALEPVGDDAQTSGRSRSTSASRAAAKRAYKLQQVDPETGKRAEPGATHTITRRMFEARKRSAMIKAQKERAPGEEDAGKAANLPKINKRTRLVDPETGADAAPGDANAISHELFSRRQMNNRRVDPATGLDPTSPSIQTVTFGYFKNHELVDAATGKRATAETEQTMTRAGYAKRRWLNNRQRH